MVFIRTGFLLFRIIESLSKRKKHNYIRSDTKQFFKLLRRLLEFHEPKASDALDRIRVLSEDRI